MQAFQRSGSFVIIVLLAILLAACGSITNQGPTTTDQNKNNQTAATNTTPAATMMPAATATAMQNGNMDAGNMMQGITIIPDAGGNMAALITTGKATINGMQVNVLLANKGFAVYYYKPDTMFQATCTGACAKAWPPVLEPQGMMTVSSSMTLPKQLSVHQTANGAQVFYDGHALYTYAADTQAGNAMGQGQGMQWYLADYTAMSMTTTSNMMQGITITPNMASNMNAFLHTGKAAINGNQVNVLMTNKGFAIYYYKSDTMFQATCTGGCAKAWPPVLAPQGMMTVSSSMMLPKALSVHQTANGAQVFYDGHALYTYATDTQAGTATGRGQDMQWYLVGFLL
jgi:predicted lipoprotein with Yx(FWY)xxD motif